MKYNVHLGHYIANQGHQYTEIIDSFETDAEMTAEQYIKNWDDAPKAGENDWWEVTLEQVNDDGEKASEDVAYIG